MTNITSRIPSVRAPRHSSTDTLRVGDSRASREHTSGNEKKTKIYKKTEYLRKSNNSNKWINYVKNKMLKIQK